MNKKIKVLTVIGTRPEIIRLACVFKVLNENTNHILVNTNQNFTYELNKIFFNDLELKMPKYEIKGKKNSVIKNIANYLISIEKILIKEKPDCYVVLGDTNSCITSYVAKRFKIPIFHIEAGNRCFDQRVPEEINRKIIDHLSDINITYSENAKKNLLRENLSLDRIFNLGSPLYEVYNFYKSKIEGSLILKQLGLKQNEYYVLSVHREENIDSPKKLLELKILLINLKKKYRKKIVFSTHPRLEKNVEFIKELKLNKINFFKPFKYTDYLFLQKNSCAVMSDSGSVTEEASILGFNAINLRETNERQEGMENGSIFMLSFDHKKIFQALEYLRKNKLKAGKVLEYENLNFSKSFYKIILSYINYVNDNVWKK
jgi:UDP-N-acetylglucosamine 2-epimerase